jgi:exosortase
LIAGWDYDSISALRWLDAGYCLSTRLLKNKYEAVRAEKMVLIDAQMAVRNRRVWFASWMFLSSLLFAHPLILFIRLSLSNDDISYVFLIPFISVWVIFIERRKIFCDLSFGRELGGCILVLGVATAVAFRLLGSVSTVDLQLSGYILSLVLFWLAGFAFFYGRVAFKAACFPLVFLFLMVPPPRFLLDRIVYLLQAGSAWITEALFDLFHVPALREGFVFHLARVDIEIAKECSGIRSSMALLVLALVATHFTLKSFWKKALFVACGLFMMILKNGIRIAVLTLLAMYVDPEFLYGKLHQRGGIVFFLVGLVLLLPVLLFLQRSERK